MSSPASRETIGCAKDVTAPFPRVDRDESVGVAIGNCAIDALERLSIRVDGNAPIARLTLSKADMCNGRIGVCAPRHEKRTHAPSAKRSKGK